MVWKHRPITCQQTNIVSRDSDLLFVLVLWKVRCLTIYEMTSIANTESEFIYFDSMIGFDSDGTKSLITVTAWFDRSIPTI